MDSPFNMHVSVLCIYTWITQILAYGYLDIIFHSTIYPYMCVYVAVWLWLLCEQHTHNVMTLNALLIIYIYIIRIDSWILHPIWWCRMSLCCELKQINTGWSKYSHIPFACMDIKDITLTKYLSTNDETMDSWCYCSIHAMETNTPQNQLSILL